MAVDNPPSDEPKSERFNMFVSKSELEDIDEWAWNNRIRSKSEAVRKLIQIGIRAHETRKDIADAAGAVHYRILEIQSKIHELLSGDEEPDVVSEKMILLFLEEMGELQALAGDAYTRALDLRAHVAQFEGTDDIEGAIVKARILKEVSANYWSDHAERWRNWQEKKLEDSK